MSEYIDRQALRNKLFSLTRTESNMPWLDTFVSIINSIPAADVAPVVRGEWIGFSGNPRPETTFIKQRAACYKNRAQAIAAANELLEKTGILFDEVLYLDE